MKHTPPHSTRISYAPFPQGSQQSLRHAYRRHCLLPLTPAQPSPAVSTPPYSNYRLTSPPRVSLPQNSSSNLSFPGEGNHVRCEYTYLSHPRPNLCTDFLIYLVESKYVASVHNPELSVGVEAISIVLRKAGVAYNLSYSYFCRCPLAIVRSLSLQFMFRSFPPHKTIDESRLD